MKEYLFFNLLAFFSISISTVNSISHVCNPKEKQTESCIEIYQPVLGFTANGPSEIYPNGCFACIETDVVSYSIVQQCDPETRFAAICTRHIDKTCGFDKDFNYLEYSNPCMACLNGNVEYILTGKCPKPNPVDCLPEQKNKRNCNQIYKPVCGYKGQSKVGTFGNSCEACGNPEVDYYFEGSCKKNGQ